MIIFAASDRQSIHNRGIYLISLGIRMTRAKDDEFETIFQLGTHINISKKNLSGE